MPCGNRGACHMGRLVRISGGAIALALVSALLGLSWGGAAIIGAVALVAGWALTFDLDRFGRQSRSGRGDRNTASGSGELLAALPVPVILFDDRQIVRQTNAAARDCFPGLVDGLSLGQFFRDPAMQDMLARLVAERMPLSLTYEQRRPEERVYEVAGRTLQGTSGLHLITFNDQSSARRIDRIRADFVANASHELRTPLAAVSGFLETLQGPARDNPEARDRFIGIMLEQTARMSRLIDDLLSLSRLESRAAPLAMSAVDLGEIAQVVATSLEGVAARNGVTIHVNISPGVQIARGDPGEVTQIIQNLIENACKYGASGGKVDLVSPLQAASGEVGLSVKDYGPGIEAEHIPRLTERFYRVDVKSSRDKQGTGLGLAIVRHIVMRHRGRLLIESALGKGATFTIMLPAWSDGH